MRALSLVVPIVENQNCLWVQLNLLAVFKHLSNTKTICISIIISKNTIEVNFLFSEKNRSKLKRSAIFLRNDTFLV